MTKKITLIILFFGLTLNQILAQAQQITSLFQGSGTHSSNPRYVGVTDEYFFFTANQGVLGTELWRSDGTVEGTTLVKDIAKGSFSSFFGGIFTPQATTIGNKVYFVANDAIDDNQIWVSDGTEAGTQPITNFGPGSFSALNVINNELIFLRTLPWGGTQIWKSDGTPEGTNLVTNNLEGDFNAYRPMAFNGHLYFWLGSQQDQTYNLWRTDGAQAQPTLLIENIIFKHRDRYNAPTLQPMYAYQGSLYAIFETADLKRGLYRIEGNDVQVILSFPSFSGLYDFAPFLSDATILNDKLYMYLHDPDAGKIQLIEIDNGTANTILENQVFEFYSTFPNSSNMIGQGNSLYFTYFASSSQENTATVSYNTTTGELKEIQDLGEGKSPFNFGSDLQPNRFFRVGEDAIVMSNSNFGENLYLIKDDIANPLTGELFIIRYPTIFNNQFFFPNIRDEMAGEEWWTIDLETNATVRFTDLNKARPTNNRSFIKLGEQFFFRSDTDSLGDELWVSDGTIEGTRVLMDIDTTGDSDPDGIVTLNNRLLFAANSAGEGRGPWYYDVTTDSTSRLINFGFSRPVFPKGFVKSGNKGYMAVERTNEQSLIYESDGTPEGTTIFYRLPIVDSTNNQFKITRQLSAVNNGLVFIQDDFTKAEDELVFIGNLEEPNPVIIASGTFDQEVFAANDVFFFNYQTEQAENLDQIAYYDTRTGTKGQIFPSNFGMINVDLEIAFNNQLIFEATTLELGREYWQYDPITNQAQSLDINPGAANGTGLQSETFTELNGVLYFQANDDQNGLELWAMDSTTMEPILFLDILEGPASSCPRMLKAIDNEFYFSAFRPDTGYELWVSNGTIEGTNLVVDILEGPASSNPFDIVNIGEVLYILAGSEQEGQQIWRFDRITGTKELLKQPSLEFNLFPNPTTNTISIEEPTNAAYDAFIFNQQGQRVLSFKGLTGTANINLTALVPGWYTINVINGHQFGSRKFLKQ